MDLQLSQFASYLQKRPHNSHKGLFGHVLIIGGDEGYSGAPLLSALGALRVGAGLVTVATHPSHHAVLNAMQPEIMCRGISTANELNDLLQTATAVVLGPGLGQKDWGKSLFATMSSLQQPLVLDADGLNLLATKFQKKSNWILTPHPGEAARLLQTTSDAVQTDRIAAAKALQTKFDGIVVLKGSETLVAEADAISRCPYGNPGMATGGMGDLLSGVIAGLIAQYLPLDMAAKLGVLVHALAGDSAAEAGERGMIATDLLPFLRKWVNSDL